jgi:hypothetical protein
MLSYVKRFLSLSCILATTALSFQSCSGMRVRSAADGRGLNQKSTAGIYRYSPAESCAAMVPSFLENQKLKPEHVKALCASAEVEDPSVPLRCYETASELGDKGLTIDLKVKLCAGVSEDDDAPLACFKNATQILGGKASSEQKVALCTSDDDGARRSVASPK